MAKLKPIKQWVEEGKFDDVPEVNGKNFKQAFRLARQMFGDDGYFKYKNKVYTTQYKEEVERPQSLNPTKQFQVLTPDMVEVMKNQREIQPELTYKQSPSPEEFNNAESTNPNPFGGSDVDVPNPELTEELTNTLGIEVPSTLLSLLFAGGLGKTIMDKGVRGFGRGVGAATNYGKTTVDQIAKQKETINILESILSRNQGSFRTVNNLFREGTKLNKLEEALQAVKKVVGYKF